MKKIILMLALLTLPACKDIEEGITQEVWNAIVGKTEQEETYTKTIQITSSFADVTGDTEAETLYFATGYDSVVHCNDSGVYDLASKPDPETKLINYQRFSITYEDQKCELYTNILGPWDATGVNRYFLNKLEFDQKEWEDIFIQLDKIIVE